MRLNDSEMKATSIKPPPSRRYFLKKLLSGAVGLWFWHRAINPSGALEWRLDDAGKDGHQKPSSGTGFIFHKDYLQHKLIQGHLESPKRLKIIMDRMKGSGLYKQVRPIRPSGNPLSAIHRIHSREHVRLVMKTARKPSICFLAVAGALAAVDFVCRNQLRNAFCAIRPPGHHATNSGLRGFCFFNNIAIAARYAQSKYRLRKILIVDWDYHHGNGTEWAFYDDPSILYFSTHCLQAFPYTGFPERRGEGPGYGYNINVPLIKGAKDRDVLNAFDRELLPAAERFKPELVLISAGFDGRKNDPIGDFEFTDDGFARLTALTKSIADQYAGSRIISILEGGYNPEGLAMAVERHVAELLG